MKRFLLAAAASLVALSPSQQASADVTKIEYSGTFSLYDETGYLNLGTTGYFTHYGTLTFLFDSDAFLSQYSTSSRVGYPGGSSELSGSYGESPGKAFVSFGGAFSSGFFGQPGSGDYSNSSSFYKSDSPGFDDMSQGAYAYSYDGLGYIQQNAYARVYSYNDDFLQGYDVDTPFTYIPDTSDGGDYLQASFSFYNYDYVDGVYDHYAYGDLTPTSVTVTNLSGMTLRSFGDVSSQAVGSVPEPSTWAMMLLGIGAAGAALRRRRGMSGVGGQPATA